MEDFCGARQPRAQEVRVSLFFLIELSGPKPENEIGRIESSVERRRRLESGQKIVKIGLCRIKYIFDLQSRSLKANTVRPVYTSLINPPPASSAQRDRTYSHK